MSKLHSTQSCKITNVGCRPILSSYLRRWSLRRKNKPQGHFDTLLFRLYLDTKKIIKDYKAEYEEGGLWFGTYCSFRFGLSHRVKVMVPSSKQRGKSFITEFAGFRRIHRFNMTPLIYCFGVFQACSCLQFQDKRISLEALSLRNGKVPPSCEKIQGVFPEDSPCMAPLGWTVRVRRWSGLSWLNHLGIWIQRQGFGCTMLEMDWLAHVFCKGVQWAPMQ